MDDIRLPMVSGTMDDISQEGDSSQDGDTPMDSMSSQVLYLRNYYYFAVSSFFDVVVKPHCNTSLFRILFQGQKAIYEREARITIDYSNLDEELKEVCVNHFGCSLSIFSQHVN